MDDWSNWVKIAFNISSHRPQHLYPFLLEAKVKYLQDYISGKGYFDFSTLRKSIIEEDTNSNKKFIGKWNAIVELFDKQTKWASTS